MLLSVSLLVSSARIFLLNQASAQQRATNVPHTINQVVMPIASAIKPEKESPIGAAKEDPAKKMPITRPNFSSGVRFCNIGIIGAL